MHLTNQHIYCYPQYHNATTVKPIQFNNSHSAVQIVHRIQPQQKLRNQFEFRDNKNNYSVNQVDHGNLRKQTIKFNPQLNEVPAPKNTFSQYQNNESSAPNQNRLINQANIQNTLRNKSLLQVKRRQSAININAREPRQEYYKGQQPAFLQQLMNKLPQIDIQPISKALASRQVHTSPPPQIKTKQAKKAHSPFSYNLKSLSLKQNDIQQNLNMKQVSSNNEESRRSSKYSSPIKNHQMALKNLKDLEKSTPNPQKYQASGHSTRRDSSITDISSGTNTSFQLMDRSNATNSSFLKFAGGSHYQTNLISIKTCNTQCQVNIPNSEEVSLNVIKQKLTKIEKQLLQQIQKNNQKQIKIKNYQNQINMLKICSQKSINQLNAMKQIEICEIKQSFEKQLAKFIADVKLKSNQQIKKAENSFISRLENKNIEFNNQIQKLKNQKIVLQQKIGDQQKMMGSYVKMLEQSKKQSLELNSKLTCQKQKQIQTKNFQIILTQQLKIQLKLSENTCKQNKNTINQQKLNECVKNLDKQIQKYKDCRQQLQRTQRKIDDLNKCLSQKQNNIKNMLKDIKNRDKHISDLNKQNSILTELLKRTCDQKIKTQCVMRNIKYKNIVEQNQ